MPESGPPDAKALERTLTGLESLVDRLVAELERARARSEEAEATRRKLEQAVRGRRKDGLTPVELQARVTTLSGENDRLKQIIREGRRRAERLRERLRALEDDAGS